MIKLTKEQYRSTAGKKKNQKSKKNRAAITMICLLLCAIAVFCVLSLTVFFKTEAIKVEGNVTYTDSQIISASSVKIGDNLIRISEEKVAEKLVSGLPFIKSVKIERDFPSTAIIVVEETTEEIYITNGIKHFSADTNGKILKPYNKRPEDNKIVFKVSKDTKIIPGQKISFKRDRELEVFEAYLDVVESELYSINSVNIEDQFDSYMIIENRMVVKFGSSSYFEEKLGYFKSGYSKIPTNSTGIFDLSSWTPESNVPRFRPQSIDSYKN